ncbi:hypothetical protein CA267_015945 [Alteromonas pelagimontana]|uniref:Uncharacterized protein n=1 Tax=Alteromonas pelagimontana TaxID=1858656 RepID=A0A6M4MG26_9ALTE|nr:hypothetical protein [Alteromonas pelagimontana]QJR82134.1 hypothetical protein CA267_015945 [Alteromonas pelagimontana]
MRISKIAKVSLVTSLLISPFTAFSAEKIAKGTYSAQSGWVKTYETADLANRTSPQQLGVYEIQLINTGWKDIPPRERKGIQRKITLKGVLLGVIDSQTFIASHTMADINRQYVIRSEGDQVLPTSGDPYCSTGVPMTVREQVNLTSATGAYANLAGGTLYFEGTVNNCPTDPEFGKNDLEVLPTMGEVVFN